MESPYSAAEEGLWYSTMLYGSPGEEALMIGHPREAFNHGCIRHPAPPREHTWTEEALEDFNASWPFRPFEEDDPQCLSPLSLSACDDFESADSSWESLLADDEMDFISEYVDCHTPHPETTAGNFESSFTPEWMTLLKFKTDRPVFEDNSVVTADFAELSEKATMHRTAVPFPRPPLGIVKKRSEKAVRTFVVDSATCRETAAAPCKPRPTSRGIKGVTQCLRALLRQLLAGTGWIMDSSISKDEATCLIKMLIGPELESRVMIDLPVENTGHLPTGWKAMYYSTILSEVMTYYIGKEITKMESEQYITHRRGPYRLSARFKEILAGRPWPPHLPHSEDLRAFGCYREGEAGHRSPGKEYTTITFVEPME